MAVKGLNFDILTIDEAMMAQTTAFLNEIFDFDEILQTGSIPRIKLLPAAFYKTINPTVLRYVMNRMARYTLPTVELVEFLKARIGDRKAIEIGSGNGDLYFHLGIAGTDSYIQAHNPEVRAHYKVTGQIPTHPMPDVYHLEASKAIEIFQPDIVIGSWITQKIFEDDPIGSGSMYGVDTEYVLGHVDTYIMIGNKSIHGEQRIMALPHEEFKPDWIVSRAKQPELDTIYTWSKPAFLRR